MTKTIIILTIFACILIIGQGNAEHTSELIQLTTNTLNLNIPSQSNITLDNPKFTNITSDNKIPVIIVYKNNKGQLQAQSDRNKFIYDKGGKVKHEFSIINGVAAELPENAIEALSQNKDVLYIQPDTEVFAHEQEITWGIQRVNAPDFHTVTKGAGVKIAILDSGIDYTHPDLNDNYKGGYDFVNNDNDPMDDYGHGTKAAGIIAAEDNNLGVLGVAPEASIYGVKVLGNGGSGSTSNVIRGIEWAIENDMDIISMSLGGTGGYYAYETAVNNAYDSGVLLVASAGNYGSTAIDNVAYPAKYDSVIAVSAIDRSDDICSFSSVGPAVELSAPGLYVTSTSKGGGYQYFSGTSAAAPFVSGVAALLIAAEPTLTNVDVRQRLQQDAEDLGVQGRDNKFGYGIPIPVINTLPLNVAITSQPDILNSGQNSKITIHVESSGVPIPNALVTISVSDGTLDINSRSTDQNGNVIFTFTAPQTTTPSTISISANAVKSGYNGGSASNTITISPLIPQIVTSMTIESKILESGQNTNVVVHLSSSGVPVSGATVDISATGGYLYPVTGITNQNGDFISVYTAPQVTSSTTVILTTDVTKSGYKSNSMSDIISINPQAVNYLAESAHPYPNSYDNTWTITEPGAGQIRIHFSRLETEPKYDFIYLYDKNDVEIARYDGTHNDMWTPWIDGGAVKIRLISDRFTSGFGFIVDHKEIRSAIPTLETTIHTDTDTMVSEDAISMTVHASSNGIPVANAAVSVTASDGSLYPITGTTNFNGDFITTYNAPKVASQTFVAFSATSNKAGYDPGSASKTLTVNPPSNSIIIESQHPYTNYYYNTWTITEPGANQIKIHFSRLETQPGNDYVFIYNRFNQIIARYDGDQNGIWTPWIEGDTLKVKLVTSGTITDFGFIVDQIETKGNLPELETTITSGSEILDSGENAQITVHVSSNGNPVSGASVDVSTSDGDIYPSTGTTNSNGEFVLTYTAPDVTYPTMVTLSAAVEKIGYNSGSNSYTVKVNPSGNTIPALETIITAPLETLESGQNTQITVHVSSNGNPVSGASVDVSTSGGGLYPVSGTTDNNGDFHSTFTAPEVTSETTLILAAGTSKTGYEDGSDSYTIIVTPLVNTKIIESQHPYTNYYYKTWTISEPGSSQIRVHFSRLETQPGNDYVFIYDKFDKIIARYDGNQNGIWTPWVQGDTLKVKLVTSGSITDFGFIVDSKETKN